MVVQVLLALLTALFLGLCDQMYADGYSNITNIDIALNAIKFMEGLNKDLPETIKCINYYLTANRCPNGRSGYVSHCL